MQQFNRQIFTTKPSRLEIIADYALAFTIALALTYGLLSYFDLLA